MTADVRHRTADEAVAATAGRAKLPSLLPRGSSLAVAWAVLAVVVAWALFPSMFTSLDPLAAVPRSRLLPPSAEHWFGTDHIGRDVYSRVVHGASLTLKAAAIALLLAFAASSAIGLAAGYFGGAVDDILMRTMDVVLAVPALLVSLMIVTALGFGTVNIAVAVGVGSVASLARLMRSETMRVRGAAYVEAAHAYGLSTPQIVVRHILPQARGPVLSLLALEFGSATLAISSLSFLGYGVPPPTPEWGNLVAEGRGYMAASWWLTALPGLVIIGTVLAVNRIGKAFSNPRRPSA